MTDTADRVGQILKFFYCAQTLSQEARDQGFPDMADAFSVAARIAELRLDEMGGVTPKNGPKA